MGFSMVMINAGRYDILSGKKEIGRVCQHVDGSWIGVIGKYITVRGLASPKQAFNEATAKHLRYDDSWKKEASKRHRPSKPAPKAEPKRHGPLTNVEYLQRYAPMIREEFKATKAYMKPMQQMEMEDDCI